MNDVERLAGAFILAFLVTFAVTPFARRLAVKTGFFDHPVGYKAHDRPTPYLGGAAVVTGFLVAAAAFGGGFHGLGTLLACVVLLSVVGTVDDRVRLGVLPRLGAQLLAAVALWTGGLGWELSGHDAVDLAVTVLWVVGLVNALNLMDNLDGAGGTVAAVSACGVALLALFRGDAPLAAVALAVAGSCAGFLPYNLTRPASIFLGDGGSVPIGLVLAASVMAVPHGDLGWAALLASVPLVGLLVFDTTLVVVSRYRRHAPILSGGRDHLTHRVLVRTGTPQGVALTLAVAQLLLSGVAIGLNYLDAADVAIAATAYMAIGALALAMFERPPLASPVAERPL